ncbi:MAG TPA: glycosyltransferase [Fimbriiglobus sp.]|jgi:glycosyltransferase involved in cell wall biosynthesis
MTRSPIRVFHLASTLGPVAGAKALSLLAPALPRSAVESTVGVLGQERTFAAPLINAGIDVRALVVRPGFDPAGWLRVRTVVSAERPDVLHAWDRRAAGIAWFLTRPRIGLSPAPRIVLSDADRPIPGLPKPFMRHVLRSADRVLAFGSAEAGRYRAWGVPDTRLVVTPQAVAPASMHANIRPSLGVPPDARYLVAVSGFHGPSAVKGAVWAFDIIRYIDPTIRLVVVGDGPARGRVERFARAVGSTDNRVVFVGERTDVPAILAGATAVWITAARGGTNVALEALAAGSPVVGYRTADLEQVISDNETGWLIPPGDRVALAGRTLELIDNSSLRGRIARAGQIAATTQFNIAPVANCMRDAYHALTAKLE